MPETDLQKLHQPPPPPPPPAPLARPSRAQARLAALDAAARVAEGRLDSASNVLAQAAAFEAWLLREVTD